MPYLAAAGVAFVLTFLGELPDKSLFASLVLGTRYRPAYVWAGVAAAFTVHVGIAVTAGGCSPCCRSIWWTAWWPHCSWPGRSTFS